MFGKLRITLAFVLLLLLALPTFAAAQGPVFPDLIELPTGFAPEGIATGRGTTFYAGSLSGMGIFRGDLRTGEGEILTAPEGAIFTGMKVGHRSNYLFVAGGATGMAYVFDAGTGDEIASLQLVDEGEYFINDVALTWDAAYFTNSFQPYIYRIPIGARGAVDTPLTAETIELSGDWEQGEGFGANGILSTPGGRFLIIVHSTQGMLYRIDPATGEAMAIDLGGADVTMGDGILLQGRMLYVVRNRANEVAVLRMGPDYLSAEFVETITNPNFAVPTTIAAYGNSLYAVNAKFGTAAEDIPNTPYEVVRFSR